MSFIVGFLGGNFNNLENGAQVSEEAQNLIRNSFADLPGNEVRDYHVHLAGIGTGNTGCFINPAMQSPFSISQYLRYIVFLSASGVNNKADTDKQYLERLVALTQNFPAKAKFGLLALDKYFKKNGEPDWEKTVLYVPNDYVMKVTRAYPDLFIPVVSVHPYRFDAVEELEKWGKAGVKMVKWLPNSMNIDPSDEICTEFYKVLLKYEMTLLVHVGKEDSIKVRGLQHLGNPLLLRRPLEMGVKIIAAHFASLGSNSDIESKSKKKVKNYELMYRLMRDQDYRSTLFCDIAAVTQVNRSGTPLKILLIDKDLQDRLINGSDYPLPGVNVAISTYLLKLRGYINDRERVALNEIYKANPLLFDYVLKRTIKSPKTGSKFKAEIFSPKAFLEPVEISSESKAFAPPPYFDKE